MRTKHSAAFVTSILLSYSPIARKEEEGHMEQPAVADMAPASASEPPTHVVRDIASTMFEVTKALNIFLWFALSLFLVPQLIQALPRLSNEQLLQIQTIVKDLKLQYVPLELRSSSTIIGTDIAQIERTLQVKKRSRLGTLQCEQCGESLATSPAVRRGPSGSKSLCKS